MKILFQTLTLIVSVLVLFFFIRMYALVFILISVIVALSSKVLSKSKNKLVVIINIVMLATIFLTLKNANGIYFPLGYSVFAFSAISLIIDQYRKPHDYTTLEILCYMFFFPKIFAGPIDRVGEFVEQLRKDWHIKFINLYIPLKMSIFACFYKYVLADRLYALSNDTYYGVNELFCIITFGIAFFLDFYAYSIFAIAFGKIFGIELSENFNSPYCSMSFREFWRRWNITLGSWLRDYIYIPLGGNKLSSPQLSINLLVVFFVSALWHNFSLPFILWGFLHATFVIMEHVFKINGNRLYGMLVFLVCCLLWQLFEVTNIQAFSDGLKRITEYQPINCSIAVGFVCSILALVFTDRKVVKNIIFHHQDSSRYVLKEVPITSIILVIDILLLNNPTVNFFYLRF